MRKLYTSSVNDILIVGGLAAEGMATGACKTSLTKI